MKKNLLLLLLLSVITSIKAQFSNSNSLYCYEFVEAQKEGMKTQSPQYNGRQYWMIVFNNNLMGAVPANKNEVQSKVLNGSAEDYYYKNANRQTEVLKTMPLNLTYRAGFYKYENEYSKGSKYTYRANVCYAIIRPGASGWEFNAFTWGADNKQSSCFSFSTDKTELIQWSTSSPETRNYYKLVDINSVKPNTDFLY